MAKNSWALVFNYKMVKCCFKSSNFQVPNFCSSLRTRLRPRLRPWFRKRLRARLTTFEASSRSHFRQLNLKVTRFQIILHHFDELTVARSSKGRTWSNRIHCLPRSTLNRNWHLLVTGLIPRIISCTQALTPLFIKRLQFKNNWKFDEF